MVYTWFLNFFIYLTWFFNFFNFFRGSFISLSSLLDSFTSLLGSFTSLIGSFEAIACGSAIQAAIINNYEDDDLERLILLDIIPVSLGIELGNGIIFLKNT